MPIQGHNLTLLRMTTKYIRGYYKFPSIYMSKYQKFDDQTGIHKTCFDIVIKLGKKKNQH